MAKDSQAHMTTSQSTAALEAGLDIHTSLVPGRHGDIPVRSYRPGIESQRVGRTMVWVHGGAFSHGDLDQPESHAVAVALAGRGAEVIAVDYHRVPAWNWFRDPPGGRLPGTRYPIPVDDIVDVYHAVARDRGRVSLGGASAGACLSAAAALAMIRGRETAPADLVLAYGTFHAELPPISAELRSRIRGRHRFRQFAPSTVRRMNWNYAGSRESMAEPTAFPGGHDLAGMPPVLAIDADHDSLRASGEAFASELLVAGVPTDYRVIAGSVHGFLNRPGTAEFDAGIDVIAKHLVPRPISNGR